MDFSVGHWGWGVGSYFLFHSLHVLTWNLYRPKRDFLWLFALFFLPVPVLFLKAGIGAALIHFWLSAQYVAVYPAFQASSPTLHLLAALATEKSGLDETSLLATAARVDREDDRVGSLRQGGFVHTSGELSALGRGLARCFLSYRSWLGLQEGRG